MSKAYKASGVDIEAGYEAVNRMKSHVQSNERKRYYGLVVSEQRLIYPN